jgi:methyl-accepting chemotaxis protein
MRRSIGQTLGAGFALPLVILTVVGGASYRALGGLLETNERVRHTYHVLDVINGLEGAVAEVEAWQRAYLITRNDDFLLRYEAAARGPDGVLQQLRDLVTDSAQQRRIEPLKALIDTKLETMRKRVELRRSKDLEAVEAAMPLSAGLQLSDQIREKSREVYKEEERLLKARTEQSESQARATRSVTVWGSLFGLVLVSVSGVFIARGITRPIQSGIQRLASSASEILTATTQQAAGTQEAAAAIQETSTTVQEVRQTAQLTSEKARAVAELVRRTAQASQDGRRATEEMLAGMRESKVRMEGIARRVLELSEQGQRIGEIIATVNDVAEQSNLLAVNAAIEAAKAGEAGRGFGVVASEVKALAERSKQATGQVRQILGEIQRATQAAVLATEQGVKASDAGEGLARRTGETIEVLNESLSEAAQSAQQIQATAQEQSAGVDQVALAMDNIKQVSTQNIAATRQMERAARDLNTLAQRFRALVSGAAAAGGDWTSRADAPEPAEE